MAREGEIGALWLNEGQGGKKYMSGNITVDGKRVDVVVFKNTFKQPGEKSPDYRVLLKGERGGSAPQSGGGGNHAPVDDDSDVPF